MDEGTHTGLGVDALAPLAARNHVAANHTEPPRLSRWERVLIWLGLRDG